MYRILCAAALAAACHAVDTPSKTTPSDDGFVPDEVETDLQPGITLPTDRTRSGVMVLSGLPNRVFIADPDNDAVHIVTDIDGETGSVYAGVDPTRMIRGGAHLYVTVRDPGQVVRFRDDGATLTESARVDLGGEPYDLAWSTDGSTLYVSLASANAVVALNADTLTETERWPVSGTPHGLVVVADPASGNDRVYTSRVTGESIRVIDTGTDVVSDLPLPSLLFPKNFEAAGCDPRPLGSRVSGEMIYDANRDTLWVAAQYVDPLFPAVPGDEVLDTAAIADPDFSGFADGVTPTSCPTGPAASLLAAQPYYTAPFSLIVPHAIGRFNPALVRFPLDQPSDAVVYHLGAGAGHSSSDAEDVPNRRIALEGFLGSIELVRNNQRVAVSMPSMGAVMVIDPDAGAGPLQDSNMLAPPIASLQVPAGPVGLRESTSGREGLWIWSWLAREGRIMGAEQFERPVVDGDVLSGLGGVGLVPDSSLPADVLRGRTLFYRGDLRTMTTNTSGASCESCHVEGRTDGRTWQFPDFFRQTPSLAGRMTSTHPVTWTGEVATVGQEAALTVQLRMGGLGIGPEDQAAITAFIDSTPDVVLPAPADPALVAEGEQIFRRLDVGCTACHMGARGTSSVIVPIFGLPLVNPPPLKGIAATAPYFHDGSAATLRDVIDRSRDGSMGDTSTLSEHELQALVAFLERY